MSPCSLDSTVLRLFVQHPGPVGVQVTGLFHLSGVSLPGLREFAYTRLLLSSLLNTYLGLSADLSSVCV